MNLKTTIILAGVTLCLGPISATAAPLTPHTAPAKKAAAAMLRMHQMSHESERGDGEKRSLQRPHGRRGADAGQDGKEVAREGARALADAFIVTAV